MKPSRIASAMTWCGLLTLLVSITLWLIVHPPELFGIWLGLFLIAPLIIPIRGLAQGRPYTFAAMSLVALLYLLIGITEGIANEEERGYAYAVLIGGALLFLGCISFVRLDVAEKRRAAQTEDNDQV